MAKKGTPNVQVFFTTCAETDERKAFAKESLAWWESQMGQVTVVTPEDVKCSVAEFNRERRVFADAMAKGNYILADDDAIPQCDIMKAFAMAQKYPQFGTLSLWPENSNINRWTEFDWVFEDDNVMEHNSVGIVRICQKGMPFPPSTSPWYDRTHGDAIREIGLKVGFLKNFTVHHLGEKKSTLSANPQK